MKLHRLYLLWLVMLLCLSCGNNTDSSSNAEELLEAEGEGDFRGVNIGDKKEDVMRSEGRDAEVYRMPDELIYRMPLGTEKLMWYEISYNFNEEGLYDISLEVLANSTDMRSSLTNEIVGYFKEKYGNPKGNKSWHVMSQSGRVVDITVTDTLIIKNKPAIRVKYYESSN
jgi:hypothetical protein